MYYVYALLCNISQTFTYCLFIYRDNTYTLQGYNCEYVSFVVILLYLRVVLGIPG